MERPLSVSIPCTATIDLAMVADTARGAPRVLSIEPASGQPGTVVTATGTALGRSQVAEVFLSDRRFDLRAEVLRQSENLIEFRIPEFVHPGRQRLLLLSAGDSPALLEQCVALDVSV